MSSCCHSKTHLVVFLQVFFVFFFFSSPVRGQALSLHRFAVADGTNIFLFNNTETPGGAEVYASVSDPSGLNSFDLLVRLKTTNNFVAASSVSSSTNTHAILFTQDGVVLNANVAPGFGTFSDGAYTIKLLALDNGNFVISYPHIQNNGFSVGAIVLYDGSTGDVISVTSESSSGDHFMGAGFLIALANGNYAASSPYYSRSRPNEGWIATFSPTTGDILGSEVTGPQKDDRFGNGAVAVLSDGRFVLGSPNFSGDKGTAAIFDGLGATWKTSIQPPPVGGSLVGGGSICVCSDGTWVLGSPDSFSQIGRISVRSSVDASPTYDIDGPYGGARLGAGPCATLSDGHTVVFGAPLNMSSRGIDSGAVYIINTVSLSHIVINGNAGDKLGGEKIVSFYNQVWFAVTTSVANSNKGYVAVFDLSGNLLLQVDGVNNGDEFGSGVLSPTLEGGLIFTSPSASKAGAPSCGVVAKIKNDLSLVIQYGAAGGDKLGSGAIDKWSDRGYVLTSPSYSGVGMVESCDGDTYACSSYASKFLSGTSFSGPVIAWTASNLPFTSTTPGLSGLSTATVSSNPAASDAVAPSQKSSDGTSSATPSAITTAKSATKTFSTASDGSLVVTYCEDSKASYGCSNNKCVRSAFDCEFDKSSTKACRDAEKCDSSDYKVDELHKAKPATLDVTLSKSNKKLRIPIYTNDGVYLGYVEIPPGTFPSGTVIRIQAFDGPTIDDQQGCGDNSETSPQRSATFEFFALVPGKDKPVTQFPKDVTIAHVANLGSSDKTPCTAFARESGDKFRCDDNGDPSQIERVKGQDGVYLIKSKFSHFTAFSVLLGSESSGKCDSTKLYQWLAVGFLCGAALLVFVVCLLYCHLAKKRDVKVQRELKRVVSRLSEMRDVDPTSA